MIRAFKVSSPSDSNGGSLLRKMSHYRIVLVLVIADVGTVLVDTIGDFEGVIVVIIEDEVCLTRVSVHSRYYVDNDFHYNRCIPIGHRGRDASLYHHIGENQFYECITVLLREWIASG